MGILGLRLTNPIIVPYALEDLFVLLGKEYQTLCPLHFLGASRDPEEKSKPAMAPKDSEYLLRGMGREFRLPGRLMEKGGLLLCFVGLSDLVKVYLYRTVF